MKRFKLILIIFLLIPFIVNANSITTNGEDADINVVVGEVEENNNVSDVEIKWKQMVFTYNVVENYVWNSETHEYTKTISDGYWTNNGNGITITNKTANKITIKPKYFSKVDYVNGKFSVNKLNIEAYSSKKIAFEIDGSLEKVNNNAKVGYITIEIE